MLKLIKLRIPKTSTWWRSHHSRLLFTSSSSSSSSSSCHPQYRNSVQTFHKHAVASITTTTPSHSFTTDNNSNNKPKFYNPLEDYTLDQNEKTILLVGDGDLSNAAQMARGLRKYRPHVHLIASVLESQQQHNQVYKRSLENMETILSAGHEIQFNVDATQLQNYFDLNSMHRIQFNFPHWRGKTNNRHNRRLIRDFISSASLILCGNDHNDDDCHGHTDGHTGGDCHGHGNEQGQIHLALLEHQSGMQSTSKSEWRRGWLGSQYAAEHGLLLHGVYDYDPAYHLSSYRFRDRGFLAGSGGGGLKEGGGQGKGQGGGERGKRAWMHVFTKVGNIIYEGHDFEKDDDCAISGHQDEHEHEHEHVHEHGRSGLYQGWTGAPREIQMYSYFTIFITMPTELGKPNTSRPKTEPGSKSIANHSSHRQCQEDDDAEDAEDAEDTEDTEDIEDAEDAEDAEDEHDAWCTYTTITSKQESDRLRLWTSKEILDEDFILDQFRAKAPRGTRTEVKPWRILREQKPIVEDSNSTTDTDTDTGTDIDSSHTAPDRISQRQKQYTYGGWKVAEYQVAIFGESKPITLRDAELFKNAIEDEVETRTRGTRRGAWKASNILPSSILCAHRW